MLLTWRSIRLKLLHTTWYCSTMQDALKRDDGKEDP
jgi:hypothetical protein